VREALRPCAGIRGRVVCMVSKEGGALAPWANRFATQCSAGSRLRRITRSGHSVRRRLRRENTDAGIDGELVQRRAAMTHLFRAAAEGLSDGG
jgi:hypothetical protein